MDVFEIQIIETIIVIAGYIITQFIINTIIDNTLKNVHLQRARRKMIVKAIHLFSLITLAVLLSAIWGLQQNEIAVFVGTLLTALGIAFFAQWSLISNITSSLLLFFNHPMKIGDSIKIIDKDSPIEGKISDLSYFFVHLKTENDEIITIPNSIFFQKSIQLKSKEAEKT